MKGLKSYFAPASKPDSASGGQSAPKRSNSKTAAKRFTSKKHTAPATEQNSLPLPMTDLPERVLGDDVAQWPPPSYPASALRSNSSSSINFPPMPGHARSLSASAASVKSKSRSASRPSSIRPISTIFPVGDVRNTDGDAILGLRNDMMVNWLYEQQLQRQYATGGNPFEGVVLKVARGSFTCCPQQMASIQGSLFDVVCQMNVRCAMTVNTPFFYSLVDSLMRHDVDYVPLDDGLRVQIVKTMTELPKCQLHHFAAFVQDSRLLVVWDDDPLKLLDRAMELESRFMQIIWGRGDEGEEEEPATNEKSGGIDVNVAEIDPAKLEEALKGEYRPIRLESSAMVGLTLALCITCIGLGLRALVIETMIDNTFIRFALLAAIPAQIFVSLFFFQALVGNLFQIFGPISSITSNSRFYSGRAPRRLNRYVNRTMPHVTIQMPVYKEGLNAVIRPTVASLKAAISTYEMQGGTANIFVNDDGMQLISEEDAEARRDFYDEHNIGWVARPKHNPRPNVEEGEIEFHRRGKFKKASNMNYALDVSNRVEERLAAVNRHPRWTPEHEAAEYIRCLSAVLEEDEGRTQADGNIRVGDYILIIDSDTRVPSDCLLDAVSEMEQSPEVAIIQFSSGVMNVTTSFFENGVTWFTNLIYTAITFAVAAGDACPFVGHNAILRWSALQHAASYTCPFDGNEKYWSESHVSEDFDMALRLQVAGYSLRYAAYTGTGFKEGVSLTVYDELARWEKYAYGCNELLFHPFRKWIFKGPFTPLFRKFVFSGIPLPKKLTIIAYIGTYYAIGAAWSLSIANYFITGYFYGLYDKYYLDSFAIYISIIAVFTGLGNLALAVLRYRLSEKSLFGALLENIKWIPMFTIFLGGISIHVSQAILCHFFEIDMVWGATAKELDQVHFGTEIVNILKKFKYTFVFCFVCTALMVCGYFVFPFEWRIQTFFSIYPLASVVVAHFALPVLLNPALMMFTW